MTNNETSLHPILKWYTGKAQAVIRDFVIPTLLAAEASGDGWPSGASRKIRAALNKQAVAAKFARANEFSSGERQESARGKLEAIVEPNTRGLGGGWQLKHAMMFGHVEKASGFLTLARGLYQYCENDAERVALATATQWCEDFAPVAQLITQLDALRPKPVFVIGTISPTVFANLAMQMKIEFNKIEAPKIVWNKVEFTFPNGQKGFKWEPEIIWPEGTIHNGSKFSGASKRGNLQCHACGHAIKDGSNWVPLVARGEAAPYSLWVGKDCARNLFNIKITGEDYKLEPAKETK